MCRVSLTRIQFVFAKLKDARGLCEFSVKAPLGYQVQEIFGKVLEKVICTGFRAEEPICKYYDSLISCMSPVIVDTWIIPSLNPCRVPFFDPVTDLYY